MWLQIALLSRYALSFVAIALLVPFTFAHLTVVIWPATLTAATYVRPVFCQCAFVCFAQAHMLCLSLANLGSQLSFA